jgi:hypothetical protein
LRGSVDVVNCNAHTVPFSAKPSATSRGKLSFTGLKRTFLRAAMRGFVGSESPWKS